MRERILRPLAAGALCICALVVGAKADCIGGAETTTAVNLRTGAGTDSSIVTTVQQGEALIVHADTGSGWYKVSLDGQTGYMSADYLSFSETMALSETEREAPASTAASASVGEQIVEFAEQYLGTPYVWGGASPSGFDCSGFVSYVMKNFGYSVNRTAASMDSNGTAVDKSELQIGDAVFFASSSESIGHVGIYIGDGEFIHSSSGCGYVTISGLDESYYSRMYVGARRIAA